MSEKRKMTRAAAIMEFFSQQVADYEPRKPNMTELKALSPEERKWFGDESIKALGAELQENT